MSLLQYRIFYATCVVVSLLFIAQLALGRVTQAGAQQLSGLEQGIQRGEQYYAQLQQLAARTYQLSQTDAGLKDVVIRQQITVKPPSVSSSSSPGSPISPGLSSTNPKNSTTNE